MYPHPQGHGQMPSHWQPPASAPPLPIRCSGFEATEDGRCSNCLRFNQDCIFTPVSAQTQAFVPAHTVWRGVGAPPPLYGAYGQPLPPANHADAYGQQPPRQGPPPPQQQQQQYLPSPTAGPYSYGPPSAHSDEGSRDDLIGRKRPHPEPHTPTLPPPAPGSASQAPHRVSGQDYAYPEPPSLTQAPRTATPSAPYSSAPPATQPYYTAQPPRQASPQSAYRYDPSRTSSSPHSQAPTTPGSASAPYYPPQTNGALQPNPPRSDGRTPPPPTSQPASRPGMRINDLVSDNGNGRSSTDSDMLNMLNRRPM
ncbi:hypothetical protein N0V95_000850 [Ascochyta clinopodiicola]|nr:hypothetical protein N0V95_000850 [Ascochyta clinopodiicola]